MAVVRSPMEDDLTPAQRLAREAQERRQQGQVTGVARSPLSTAVGGGGAVRAREITPGDLRARQNQILDDLRISGAISAGEVGAVRSQLSTAVQGGSARNPFRQGLFGSIPANYLAPFPGVDPDMTLEESVGVGVQGMLEALNVPQRFVQAGGGAIGAAFQDVGQRVLRQQQATAWGIDPSPFSGEPKRDPGFSGRFNDPTYRLTVPNLRDRYLTDTRSFKELFSSDAGARDWINYALRGGLTVVDAVAEFGLQAATDPLSYIYFGAGTFAGAGGRAALASRVMKKDVLDKIPSLRNNPERLIRHGEWGLTPVERRALVDMGIMDPQGFSFVFGGPTVKGTGVIAGAVGRPVSRARAAIGDVIGATPGLRALQGKTVPGSRMMLQGVARGSITGEEARDVVVRYAASQAARQAGNAVNQILTGRHYRLLQELVDSPVGNDIVAAIEPGAGGVRRVFADPEQQRLVGEVEAAFADMRAMYNERLERFAAEYGLDPEYVFGIESIDNYFFHTVTPDALRWIRSQRNRPSGFLPEIEQNLSIAPSELGRGSGPLRARKLVDGEMWLGETLQSGTIQEINEISVRKLGFKWFEEDAATVLQSYVNSISDQVRRLAFFERMFDFGPEYIRPLLSSFEPDPNVYRPLQKAVDDMYKTRRQILNSVDKTVAQGVRRLDRTVALANRVVAGRAQSLNDANINVTKLSQEMNQQQQAIDRVRQAAQSETAQIRAATEMMLAPLEARLTALRQAADEGRLSIEAARQELAEAHVQLFPNAKSRPTDIETLAAQVAGKSKKVYEQRAKALETKVRRRRAERARAERTGARAERRLEADKQILDEEREASEFLRTVVDTPTDTELTPDGMVFINRETRASLGRDSSESVEVYGSKSFIDEQIAAGEDVVFDAIPAPHQDLVFRPADTLDDFRELADLLPNRLSQFLEDVNLNVESSYFRVLNAVDNTPVKSQTVQTNGLNESESVLANILFQWRKARQVDPESFEKDLNNIVKALGSIMETNGMGPQSFDVAERLVRDAIVDSFDSVYTIRLNNIISSQGGDPYLNIGYYTVALPSVFEPDSFDLFVRGNNLSSYLDSGTARSASQGTREWDYVFEQDPVSAMLARSERQAGVVEQAAVVRESAETAASAAAEAQQLGRELGGVRAGGRRAEQRIERLTEEATAPEPRVTAEEKKLQRRIVNANRAMEAEIKADPAVAALPRLEDQQAKLGTRFDAGKSLQSNEENWQNTVLPLYQREIDEVADLIVNAPPPGEAGRVAGVWAERASNVVENLNQLELTPQERAAYDRVFNQLFSLEADLARIDSNINIGEKALEQIRSGEFGQRMVKEVLNGWREISNLGVQVPAAFLDDLAAAVPRLNNPAEWQNFVRHYFAYQKFFKSWAIATPGFTIRNAMTAAFNNFVAGVTPKDTTDGIKFAVAAARRQRGGVDYALNNVPVAERQVYQDAYEAVAASGGGQAIDEVMPLIRGQGSRLYNNAFTRTSQRFNEVVETGMRMGMALNAARNGMDVTTSSARIARYQFDYSDLSQMDMYAKSFIPFWVFAVRNVPLQMTNMIARPSMYRAYENLKELEADADDSQWPLWLRERDPIKTGGASYLNLDLPQVEMEEQIMNLLSGRMLISQANPLFRIPLEGALGRSARFDTPFSSQPRRVGVTDIPSAGAAELLRMLGAGEGIQRGPDGGRFISDWEQQIGPGLIPPIQQFQRVLKPLLPESVQETVGGTPRYAERDALTVLGAYLGIPVGQVTQENVEAEMRRRRFDMDAVRRDVVRRARMGEQP